MHELSKISPTYCQEKEPWHYLVVVGSLEAVADEPPDTVGQWTLRGLWSSTSSPLKKDKKESQKEHIHITLLGIIQSTTGMFVFVCSHLPAAQDG